MEDMPGYAEHKTQSGFIASYSVEATTEELQALLQKEYAVTMDVMVPLLFERGVQMLVAIYGVLMAGGAYVPLEPHYPKARILAVAEQVGKVGAEKPFKTYPATIVSAASTSFFTG
eukprot:4296541-Amphidinium_carterae.1